MTARGHLLGIISGFRALEHYGVIDGGIMQAPFIGPGQLAMSLRCGPLDNLRRAVAELGASEPEQCGCDGETWFGSDLRIGDVTVRLTSEHVRIACTDPDCADADAHPAPHIGQQPAGAL